MKAVIILPTYNERENIELMLEILVSVTRSIKGYQFTILVVDDNSPDKTAEKVRAFPTSQTEIVVLTGKKEGLGKALLRGMTYAIDTLDADVIAQMDADLSHDPKVLPHFFEKLSKGYDFVVGSRYIPGGSIPQNWGIHRKIFSVVGNAIVRYGLGFTNVHDWTGGFRVFHKKYFELAKPKVVRFSGYVYQIAFLHNAVLAGANIGEVPIHFTDRRFGRSKIAPLQYIRNVLVYVFVSRLRQMRHGPFGKFAVVGTIGFIINTIILEMLVRSGFHPAIGSALGAECAIISNFTLNNNWTFRGRKISGLKMIPKFLQFNATSFGALLIQSGTVALGTLLFGREIYRWFYLLGVGIGMLWNYLMYSRVIWKHPKS
ncbi:MAG TPA: glycosyltransferase family 2 protein [Patescibacteria group bacterium]|nr:glycosyltransferase family 2 protein [Patescibacteria group bacterium]